jgi:chromosome segregation ATPase
MSTAATVLARFLQDLRNHKAIRLERPGVPESLREASGELIGQLWTAAYNEARADLEKVRLEFQDEAARARADVEDARQAVTEAEAKTAELAGALQNSHALVAERDALVAGQEREVIRLQAEIATLRASLAAAQERVEQGKLAFSGELEALTAAIALTEERAKGAERRALSEIEVARHRAREACR